MMVTRQITILEGLGDVRFGSKADMCIAKSGVRFTPNSGLMHRNKKKDRLAAVSPKFKSAYQITEPPLPAPPCEAN